MAGVTKYTEAKGREICHKIMEGYTLREIAEMKGMPAKSTIFKWLAEQDGFSDLYARAREIQMEDLGDEMLEIADDGSNDWMRRSGKDEEEPWVINGEHVQRSKVRIDTRKWLMSKLSRRYAEKQTHEHTGEGGGPVQFIVES